MRTGEEERNRQLSLATALRTFQTNTEVFEMLIFGSGLPQATRWFFMACTLVGFLILAGCDGEDITGPDGHQVEQIVIVPDTASIPVGGQLDFSAFLLTAAGDTVDTADLNVEWNWWSSNPDVFTVEAGGLATGHNPGEEFCIVEATIFVGSSNFNGRDSAFVVVF